jgi:hypothetical protein
VTTPLPPETIEELRRRLSELQDAQDHWKRGEHTDRHLCTHCQHERFLAQRLQEAAAHHLPALLNERNSLVAENAALREQVEHLGKWGGRPRRLLKTNGGEDERE